MLRGAGPVPSRGDAAVFLDRGVRGQSHRMAVAAFSVMIDLPGLARVVVGASGSPRAVSGRCAAP